MKMILMKKGQETRKKILNSANKLFYRKGFNLTSFSDLVDGTGLSKGNITYHFKSKENLLAGVLSGRFEKTQKALAKLEVNNPDANLRLEAFIDSLLDGKMELSQYGCPNGSLAYELGKNQKTRKLSRDIFELIRLWLTSQFRAIGNTQKHSEELAMELFTRGQGICILAQVYNDHLLFENEVKKLKSLLRSFS